MARKRKPRNLDAQEVLRVFKQSKKPLTPTEVLGALRANKRELGQVEALIQELQGSGQILHLRRGAYGLVENLKLITGVLEVQRSGVGFVLPDDKNRQDIFINPANMGGAWHGDRVAVALFPDKGGRRQEGRVARVLERRRTRLTVRVAQRLGDYSLCQPTDSKLQARFMVPTQELAPQPNLGDVLTIKPKEQLDNDLWAAEALDRLGEEDDVAVQEAVVKINHDIPTVFPQEVLDQAALLPTVPSEDDFRGREDLRHLDLVTIDGAMAKDFDDAVCVHKDADGYRIFVAIADVAHYVPPDSAMDLEAQERGNSCYFPQSVEPMFPEALSNGLCSLNPGVPRLAMAVEMGFSHDGMPRGDDVRLFPAVIQSKARITYAQVKRALLDKEPEERRNLEHVLPMLEIAEALARQIRMRRMERGSLDFDLPEPEIMFNLTGETVDIRPKVRHFGHQIIEEFMIAANEAVARHLEERGLPCLYRIHPEPDPEKLVNLFKLLERSELAGSFPAPTGTPSAQDLQVALAAAHDTDLEFIVGRLALRSMMQAKYSPENQGHYGLASECYGHFTSPIRRYADLVVHRSVKQSLAKADGLSPGPRIKGLNHLATHLSDRERKAMDAEREILKRLTVIFLRDRVGEVFTGVINSLADFGFWVELNEVMAEGAVRLSTMHDDYYTFIPERQELLGERTGRILRMGQTIEVKLVDVNLSRLEVTLELADMGPRGQPAPRREGDRRPAAAKKTAPAQGAGRRTAKKTVEQKSGEKSPQEGKGKRKRYVPRKRKSQQGGNGGGRQDG